MCLIYARIGTIPGIVLSETAVFICTIDQIIRQAGSWKRSLNNLKDRDGKESATLS